MATDDNELAIQLEQAVKRIHRVRWASVGALCMALVVAFVAGAVLLIQDQERLRASCAFYRDLGIANVAPQPPAKKPGELGIALVIHARDAYAGEGCGQIAPPSAVLRRWAAYYRLTVR